jgi:hypothetical protein
MNKLTKLQASLALKAPCLEEQPKQKNMKRKNTEIIDQEHCRLGKLVIVHPHRSNDGYFLFTALQIELFLFVYWNRIL